MFYLFSELAKEIYSNLSGIPHTHVYYKHDIPREYHYTHNRRIAPIILEPEEHFWVSYNNSNGTGKNTTVYRLSNIMEEWRFVVTK